jgi:predicted P-loop ATPase
MTSDLLFSILPREGKVPIAHDSQKVTQVEKQEPLKALSDEKKELKGEEREAREKQQEQQRKQQTNAEEGVDSDPVDVKQDSTGQKKPKGPKHLDIYV